MRIAPRLDSTVGSGSVRRCHALLINPFYPKDPHASFGKHVLTPLFRQMDSEGRLLHRNWNLYDTAHAVFQPKQMSAEQLEEGYARCYRRIFSHASIWKRRPTDWRCVPPYLAMSYLYKRSNLFWHLLIRNRLTALAWRPLVEVTRRRHVAFRRRLMQQDGQPVRGPAVVSAGV